MSAGHTSTAGSAPKQFVSIGGEPILIHSLRAFIAVDRVDAIYVAVRESEMNRVRQQIRDAGMDFCTRIFVVAGGENRQESVANALGQLSALTEIVEGGAARIPWDIQPDDVVLVHDAVRPLIDVATIDRTIDAVIEHGAALVAMPAVDTIKQVERTAHGAIVSSTIPRERVVHAQTPQGALYRLLRRAFDEARRDEFLGTDEASLLERAGIEVAVVPGSARNFKITQHGDLELAEFYLAGAR